MANATTTAILDTVRSKLPGVSTGQINLELFNTVDELAREALRVSAPTDPTAEPDTWLTSALWVPNYQVILDGVLYRLYAQFGKAWASAELASFHKDRYNVLLQLSRTEAAAAPTTVYERVIFNLRMRIPVARDAELKPAVFYAVNKIRVDALGLTALGTVDATPSLWLPADKWDVSFQSLLQGALAQLYLQVNKPWSSPELGAAAQSIFEQELDLLGTDELVDASSVYQRLINTVRAQLPTAREAPVKLALFAVADKVRIDALRLAPLADADTDPSSWIPQGSWDDCYQALLYGVLSRLQMQVGQPWSNPEAAGANQALFLEEFALLRGDQASSPATVFDRLVNNLRVQIPQLRDGTLRLELYNTADKIRREALWLDPLTDANTDPTTWLPSDKWDNCYQALLHGTLFRLFSQPGKPWSNPEFAKEQFSLYQVELDLVRGEQSTKTPASNFSRLMDILRVRLPGARDNVISIELYLLINEFLQESNVWVDEIDVTIVPGQDEYTISSINGVINRLMTLVDADDRVVPCRLTPPTLYNPDFALKLGSVPSNTATFRAYVAITLDPNAQPEDALPDWIITKYREGIEDGLLARMMLQVAKPYSNPKLAQYHTARYRRAIALARNEALHAYKFRGQGWSYPRNFFGKRIARI